MSDNVTLRDSRVFKNLEVNADWNSCIDSNGASLGRCINNCKNESECENSCLNIFKSNQLNCPCEVKYIETRWNINMNHLFKENCSSGCPCEEWDCESTITTTTNEVTTTAQVSSKSVLVLSNTNSLNTPMVVGFDDSVIWVQNTKDRFPCFYSILNRKSRRWY